MQPAFERVEARTLLATFSVTNTTDNTGAGSLRYAITQSNATPGSNVINFDIAPSGVQTIALTSALPTITVPVTINGLTEPGTTSSPTIVLYGTGQFGIDGLDVTAGNSTIEGLAIDNLGATSAGIALSVAGGNIVQNDFLGTDDTGTMAATAALYGVLVEANSNNNTIRDNLISTNNTAIFLNGSVSGASGTTTSGNLIVGNLIGTDLTGTQNLGTDSILGISLQNAADTTIGGTIKADRNVVSNLLYGIYLQSNVPGTLVEGNYLGTDITGEVAMGNSKGIIDLGNTGMTIGGTAAGAGNVISASTQEGVFLDGTTADLIEGNLIGTDATGTKPLGNATNGVYLNGGNNTTIGGSVAGAGNVISASGGDGIDSGGMGIVIQGNRIGTDITGTKSLGNAGDGVRSDGHNGGVGGPAPQDGNIIANNGFGSSADPDGVRVDETKMPVLSNSIYNNKAIGIACDQSTGNYIQSAPVLTSADSIGSGGTIAGILTSAAGTYTLQFFSTPTLDSSGNAEGETLLGSSTLTVTGTSSRFSDTIASGFTAGNYITATATDASGDTSEFSVGIVGATAGPPAVTAMASVPSVSDGQKVTDTFTMTNLDTANDAGVTFRDPIPAGTSFVSGVTSTGAPVVLAGGVATATIGSLATGQSVTVSIVLMTSPTAEPSFTNTASVTATTPVVASGTDTASTTTAVTPSADQSVAITPPSPTTTTGRLTFVVTTSNHGPDPVYGSTLTDTLNLPAGATLASQAVSEGTVSVSGNVVTANFGTLAYGANATLTLVVIARGDATFEDSAVVTSTSTDPNSANNSANVSVNVRGVASVGINSSAARSTPQKAVTLTSQVAVPPGFPAASGSVTFYDATTPLGTAALNAAGVATLAVNLIAVGTHGIAAVFSGDTNYAAVVSTATPVKIADPVPNDFDGDGKSDVAIYDQTSGIFAINNSGGGSRIALLGNLHDVNIPVFGDYDGDGRTDLAVYDQTAALFLVLESGGGTLNVQLGNPRDVNIPVAGDFDGDGKTNLAIFDQTTATFYVLESGKVVSQQLGIPGDKNIPVAGDFDGDGKTDFAVYDQTQATFLVLYSGGGSRVQQLGSTHDVNIPIAGDFDGDGKTDLAIYDQTASTFLVLESGGGTIAKQFGIPTDVNVPVLGDFDGDGKADIAIFDASSATFLVLESGGDSIVEKYGNPQDKNFPA